MSLINQMLRDLEAGSGRHTSKPTFLHAAPPQRKRWQLADWLLAIAGAAIGVGSIVLASWSLLRPAPGPSATAPQPSKIALAATATPAPLPRPTTASPAPAITPATTTAPTIASSETEKKKPQP